MERPIRTCLLIFLISLSTGMGIFAQNTVTGVNDLSNIQVDNLTDDQIQQLWQKVQQNGYTMSQLETMALAKGMSQAEITKLKTRINKLSSGLQKNKTNESVSTRSREIVGQKQTNEEDKQMTEGTSPFDALFVNNDSLLQLQKPKPEERIFGYSLFSSKMLSFEPSLNIATPKDYQLGPGDEVIIDVWGASEENYRLSIAPDGYIFINNIGPVFINGLTVDEASKKIIGKLSSIYSGLKGPHPNTFAQVSLGNIRSIQVTVIGEVNNPGTYTVSSLASVFNALYLSGGPNINGSLRNIEVIRNNKVMTHLDVYDFLLRGDQTNNIRLQDQDVIRIPPYKNRIIFAGEVKRPAIYEVSDTSKEILSSVVEYTGGFTDKAYTQRLKIYRKTQKELKIVDVPATQFNTFVMHNGDSIPVEPVLDRFENRVTIEGAVFRPGDYALTDSMTIARLIRKAEGLKGDAFLSRASLYRTKDNYTIEVIPVDLFKISTGKSPDISLKREDILKVSSILDLQDDYTIEVLGEVKNPGVFPFVDNAGLEDYILIAGGLLESASLAQIEIARRVKNSQEDNQQRTAEIYTFNIDRYLSISDSAKHFVLQPFDQVYIRRSPGYEEQKKVRVEGEVLYPGEYALSNRTERISDLIKRAGGLTMEAYSQGARLTRKPPREEEGKQKALQSIMAESNDSLKLNIYPETEPQPIGIDLTKILNQPYSNYDLILMEGDVLTIPKELQTVKLSGSLLYPVTVRYNKSYSFNRYISQAGGYSDDAKKSKSYVIYANGSVDRTHKVFFFNVYPRIEPGAEIIVPSKNERKRLTTGETVSLVSSITSLSLIVVTLIKTIW